MQTGKPHEGQNPNHHAENEPISPIPDEHVSSPLPSLEYLLTCSKGSLQDVQLTNLNRAANCLKQARIEWNEACAHREAAGVALWLINNREALLQQCSRSLEVILDDELPSMVTIRGSKKGLDSLLGAPPKPREEE
jgi:hypothetical protein